MPPLLCLLTLFILGSTKKFHTRGLNRDLVGGNFAISMPASRNPRFLRVLQGAANAQAPAVPPENPKKWGISRNLNRASRMTTRVELCYSTAPGQRSITPVRQYHWASTKGTLLEDHRRNGFVWFRAYCLRCNLRLFKETTCQNAYIGIQFTTSSAYELTMTKAS